MERSTALIIDANARYVKGLAEKLTAHFITVVVSRVSLTEENIILVAFQKHGVNIPKESYSYIFFVWEQEKNIKELLLPLVRKAYEKKSEVIIISQNKLQTTEIQSELGVFAKKVAIAVLGDVFDTPSLSSPLDQFILNTNQTKMALLDGMGLSILNPISYKETIDQILHVAFKAGKKEGTYYIFSAQGQTQLSIVHALQKTDPEIKIDFSTKNPNYEEINLEGEYLLSKEYSANSQLQKLYKEIQILGKPQKLFIKKNKSPSKIKKIFWYAIFSLLILIVLPIVSTFLAIFVSGSLLISSKNQIEAGDINSSLGTVQAAKVYVGLSKTFETLSNRELSYVGLSFFADKINNLTEQENTLCDLGEKGIIASKIFETILSGHSKNPNEDSLTATGDLKNLFLGLETIKNKNGFLSLGNFPISNFLQFTNISDNIPEFIGTNTKKTYLILFSNNMELRPGGGFIGSYGILHLDHGKFIDFKIHDVYDADGQLLGHVDAPFFLARYLPVNNLYLRDSNYDVDFAASASISAKLYEAEENENVDGVISVDLSFVRNILDATGPVFVPEYNVNVDSNNLFLLAEEHAEKNFFPGSSAKKDFLEAVANAIEARFISGKISYLTLLSVVINSVEEKHFLVALQDSIGQKSLSLNGFSSSLLDLRDSDQINDFLGINEANVGVNKANYFITRSVSQEVEIDTTGVIRETLAIKCKNTSKTNSWPGGDYKNYLRIILPEGTSLDAVSINNIPQNMVDAITDPTVFTKKGFISPKGLEVDKNSEEGKLVFGFLTTIPANSTQTVIVSYTLTQKFDTSRPINNYSLEFFKQPGVDSIPYSLDISYPKTYDVLSSNNLSQKEGNLGFEKDIVNDSLFSAEFAKK